MATPTTSPAPVINTRQNTPTYNATTGGLTDFGRSIGANPMLGGQPISTTSPSTKPSLSPTPVVSGSTASNFATNTITPTLNNANAAMAVHQNTQAMNSQQIMDQQIALNTKNAGQAGWVPLKADGINGPKTQAAQNFKPTAAPTTDPNSVESTIANTPDPGQTFQYDTNGLRHQVPIGSVNPGLTTNPPVKPGDKPISNTVSLFSGNNVVQYTDGTYGITDMNGNFIGTGSQTQFDQGKEANDALAKLHDAMNGAYPLKPEQTAQITGITAAFQQLIAQQQTQNANATGVETLRQNMNGMGTSTSGQGSITGVINDGAQKIADLTSKMAASVAQMTDGFNKDNLNMLKTAYDSFKGAQDDLQSNIDKIEASIEQAKKDQYNQVQQPIDDLAALAAKDNAPPDVIAKIRASKNVIDATQAASGYLNDPTSPAGQYSAYVRKTQSSGKTPISAGDFLAAQKYKEAYASASAANSFKVSADSKEMNRLNDKLQKFVTGGRTGAYGIEANKVDSALHAASLFNQYKDANGNYNIPTAQYAELGMSLANLISGTGTATESQRADIASGTAFSDWKKVAQWITGVPQTGNTQDIIKNLVESVNRQGSQAETNRNTIINATGALTTLDPVVSQNVIDKFTKLLPSVAHPENNLNVSAQTPEQITENADSAISSFGKTSPDNDAKVKALFKIWPNSTDVYSALQKGGFIK